ncbi:hypothetical protein [Wolbachia endosymbiont (group B) of Gerris lacustris]|uniref:hypothetical protein n=1 Tax=Wolbachia endosymbiont (group B) of Gerris lacustris TaxID=3066159 RepID=UPI00333EC879
MPVSDNLVNDIRESLELIKNGHSQKEEITKELQSIYQLLAKECDIIEEDYLDSLKYSSANNEPLSDKYSVEVAYKNLNIVVEALRLLVSDNKDIDKTRDRAILLQKKMKEALEKMQQQKSQKELFELEKKSKEEFSKYINGTIDGVSIEKYKDLDFFMQKSR